MGRRPRAEYSLFSQADETGIAAKRAASSQSTSVVLALAPTYGSSRQTQRWRPKVAGAWRFRPPPAHVETKIVDQRAGTDAVPSLPGVMRTRASTGAASRPRARRLAAAKRPMDTDGPLGRRSFMRDERRRHVMVNIGLRQRHEHHQELRGHYRVERAGRRADPDVPGRPARSTRRARRSRPRTRGSASRRERPSPNRR